MTMDLFRYDGKRVVVVGGATGMGASTARMAADLGAEVVVIDVAEVAYDCAQSVQADLRSQTEVDTAIDAIGGPVHAVFACAGVADGTPGLMLINFTSQRHLIERMVMDDKLVPGGSVAVVSSVAGLGWRKNIDEVKDFLNCRDWATAAAWTESHPETDNYSFSKEVINCYVAQQGFALLTKGIRINAILPGPTDTPLARANADLWLSFAADYRKATNSPTLHPDQMASTMIFLCSAAASGVNGVTLLVDQGHVSASLIDSFDDPLVKMIAGEMEFDLAALGFE